MAIAGAAAAARRDRLGEAAPERARSPIQLEERPDGLAPARGVVLALALGLSAWALAIAAFVIF